MSNTQQDKQLSKEKPISPFPVVNGIRTQASEDLLKKGNSFKRSKTNLEDLPEGLF